MTPDRIWLKQYSEGVPHDIDPERHRSLVHLFDTSVSQYADKPSFANLGRTLSYRELSEYVDAFAAYLGGTLKLGKGERVAIMMPNLLQYPVALFGVLKAGLVVVNVNPLYTPRELKHQLRDSGAQAIVVLANSAHTLADVIDDTPVTHVVLAEAGDMLGWPKRWLVNLAVRYVKKGIEPFSLPQAVPFRKALSLGGSASFSPPEMQPDDLAFLQYTGGTTGRSKGAMLTHRNLIANVEQVAAWFTNHIEEASEIIITALPLYHVYALTCNCLSYVQAGSLNVLITDPRDMKGFVDELQKWPFTAITGVNTLYAGLLNCAELSDVDFSHLKLSSAGGAAVQKATAQGWANVTGSQILEGYGLSEASPVVTTNPADTTEWTGSIGIPMPSTDVSLRDDQLRPVPAGERGELCVRGPQVMTGYWNNEEATSGTFTEDGYLRTGDVAVMDERGYFRIVDRLKDMILVSGFNVFPNEIEDVLTQMDAVLEAAVVGIADDKTTEAVKAFVVFKPGRQASKEEIVAHCRDSLAAYKVPRHVEVRDELPKSNVGKILRRELK